MSEKIKIPRALNAEINLRDDLGSNIMEAYVQEDGPLNGFMGQVFLGYESQGRRQFTLGDVQRFLAGLLGHEKFKPHSKIIVDILGTTDFSGIEFEEKPNLSDHSKTKKKHLKTNRDSRGNRFGGGRR